MTSPAPHSNARIRTPSSHPRPVKYSLLELRAELAEEGDRRLERSEPLPQADIAQFFQNQTQRRRVVSGQ